MNCTNCGHPRNEHWVSRAGTFDGNGNVVFQQLYFCPTSLFNSAEFPTPLPTGSVISEPDPNPTSA